MLLQNKACQRFKEVLEGLGKVDHDRLFLWDENAEQKKAGLVCSEAYLALVGWVIKSEKRVKFSAAQRFFLFPL